MLLSVVNLKDSNYFIKELIWFLIGFIIIFIINRLNINYFFKYSFYLYLLGNLLLLFTLIYGNYVNGARNWLNIGIFSFQPSEFMKIFLIIYLRYFTLKYKISNFKYTIYTGLIVLLPSILTFLEPDTGGVIIYLIIWFVYLFLRRINKWFYIISIGLLIVLLGGFLILYYNHQNVFINLFGTSFFYRMDRITNFINGDGYQLNEALKSTSNSGLLGLDNKVYFPEKTTDFVISLFISNFGIIGLLFLLIIYNLLFIFLGQLNSDKYILYSLLFILLFQYGTNILMNIGYFPIMGITLPFLSYGGSSLISYMIIIGLVLKEKASFYAYL